MLRIVRLGLVGLLLFVAWIAALQRVDVEPQRTIVLLAPLLALVALGIYLLAALTVGVLTFRTVPAEAELLRKDIDRARKDLAARGFKD